MALQFFQTKPIQKKEILWFFEKTINSDIAYRWEWGLKYVLCLKLVGMLVIQVKILVFEVG